MKVGLCPRCGRYTLQKVSALEEACEGCGYAKVYGKGKNQLLYDCAGFGQIAYTDYKTGERVYLPFEDAITRATAKRKFRNFFRERTELRAVKRELSWFDCEKMILAKYDEKENTWKEEGRMQEALCDDGGKRWEDTFSFKTRNEAQFLAEIEEMELETFWLAGVESRKLCLLPIPSLIEVADISQKYGLDQEQTYASAEDGTKLILNYGKKYYIVSSLARPTLYETAKLCGSALGRMPPTMLAETLNNGLKVARGKTLMLIRYGKVMAFHSDGTYCVMPISSLVESTKNGLREFGAVEFISGCHSNQYTTALWSLPDAQGELISKYQYILDGTVSCQPALDFMPVCRFSVSDTAHCAAILKPMFQKPNGVCVSFHPGISLKHERKTNSELYGIDLYEEEVTTIFSKFYESLDVIQKMASTEIHNPLNCVMGLFNWLNRGQTVIPRKYTDAVRMNIENAIISSPIMSMHDIYLFMMDVIGIAESEGISMSTLRMMDDALSKVLTANWSKFDVEETASWGGKTK